MTVPTIEEATALRTAFLLRDMGHPLETILASPFIPAHLREWVRSGLERDANITLTPARMVIGNAARPDWLAEVERGHWLYWPALREYLLGYKGWPRSVVQSLDDASDRIVRQLAPPWESEFDVRGLVLGFIQSGKTANFTAVLAKSADIGYRLIVVLSGVDNGLRRQTNVRLKRELIGYPDNRPGAVRLPPVGQQWHEFTRETFDGDFHPGLANHAALQGSQPVLIVAKKNGPVLRRLLRWLDDAPEEVHRTLPFLLIDDEADQASLDTRGTLQTEVDPPTQDYEPPSTINGLIRDLLCKFERRAYVAYTATPFANILIPHDTVDPHVGNDLYPKDFIIDLPKPNGYFGTEEFFGRFDSATGMLIGGMDAIRSVPDQDFVALTQGEVPDSLQSAVIAFILAGAARAQRGDQDQPATMLIHTSHLQDDQATLALPVAAHLAELRDEWRYQRSRGIREKLRRHWDMEMRPATRALHLDRDVAFEAIEPHIGPFFEAVQVRVINSETGEVLDYEREPTLKAIAVGGNRLSRGLTLEGLIVSYFVRRSVAYDTLLQMGRWFGFREGYDDLTRIWTTAQLAGWFTDLAFVEYRLREDIAIYEEQGLTPFEVGMRIWQHPTMQVTSRLKRRHATPTIIQQTYSLQLEQTFKYPLDRAGALVDLAASNKQSVVDLVSGLGRPTLAPDKGPIWLGVPPEAVLSFLRTYQIDPEASTISLPLVRAYIERATLSRELIRWTIAVRGLEAVDPALGEADWGLPTGPIAQVSRSRIGHTNSLGVIVDPPDEGVGLQTRKRGRNARAERPAEEGLLILYPISRNSTPPPGSHDVRRPLFPLESRNAAPDLVGLAISFPASRQPQVVEAYLEGTVRWRPVE